MKNEIIEDCVRDFQNISFVCRAGGAPGNRVGVPEVLREEEFAYATTANGDAFAGEVVVLCRDTGTKDSKGRNIYITPEGAVFVYRYHPGSPASFDKGCLREPEF